MSIHDEIQDLIPAYVLGAVEPDEAARAKTHLASCAQCARVLEQYQPVVDALAFTVPLVPVPRNVKTLTMQRALQTQPAAGPRAIMNRPGSWWQRLGLVPLLASAALAISILTLGWNTYQSTLLGRQLAAQRDLTTVLAYAQGNVQIIRGTNLAPRAVGRLYVDPDGSVAALITVNMPPLGPDRVYQVWLTETTGRTTSGGTFTVDNEGDGWLLVRAPQDLGAYAQVGVTAEPRGGSPDATSGLLLTAKITSR